MKTGFIGLGQMGSNMAANLLNAGHDVIVYNRTREKLQELAAQGAQVAESIEDACRGDVLITMLADDVAAESVAFKKDGIIAKLNKKAIHISMSTISVALAERLAIAHENADQYFISAPVFGRPDAATAGKLFIIAAGEKAAVDFCMPLFDVMGQKTFYIGERQEDANLVKLSGNFLVASIIEGLGEAMALIAKAGIDRRQYLDILTSSLFTAPSYQIYGKQIIEGKYQPAGFTAPLGQKDIRLTIAAAENLRVPMPMVSLLHDRFLTLLAQDGELLDWAAIAQLSAKDSGLKIQNDGEQSSN